MTAGRRLAADVVGYSRLMGEDEARGGQSHLASLKSGMLTCKYLHYSMAMGRTRETASLCTAFSRSPL